MNVERLQYEITEYFYTYSALHLKTICKRYGLECDASLEPMQSKRVYIRSGLLKLNPNQIQELTLRIIRENDCPQFVDAVDGYLDEDPFEITMKTRRAILNLLSKNHLIEGKEIISKFLNRVWNLKCMPSSYGNSNAEGDIIRHMQANDDLSYDEMFDLLNAIYICDDKFKQFLNQLVHPEIRINLEEQLQYVKEINEFLSLDGYILTENRTLKGNPVFEVEKCAIGVCSSVNNLIFAPKQRKPDIVIEDALSNILKLRNNEDNNCLVYSSKIDNKKGLIWKELVIWWNNGGEDYTLDKEKKLYKRLEESLDSEVERIFFKEYYRYTHPLGGNIPALIPQVYCHYDPKSAQFRNGDRYVHQRMDFLMLFPRGVRIVIEIDGKQHYSIDGEASPKLYAEMVSDDRNLKLYGYDVYRFGGYEFKDARKTEKIICTFIRQLFLKYNINI